MRACVRAWQQKGSNVDIGELISFSFLFFSFPESWRVSIKKHTEKEREEAIIAKSFSGFRVYTGCIFRVHSRLVLTLRAPRLFTAND